MTFNYSSIFSQTPQTEKLPGSDQVANSGGGYSYKIDKWDQLYRFLILGSESGTYYSSARKLTVENAQSVIECIKEDGKRVLKLTKEISHSGRAPKNDPAIFVLALLCTHGDEATKYSSYRAIPLICRIGTFLFTFMEYVTAMRGWSRGLRKGVAEWYLEKTQEQLEYQILKYQQRNGWSHKDVLRLCHAKPNHSHYIFSYAVNGMASLDGILLSGKIDAVKYLNSLDYKRSPLTPYGIESVCSPISKTHLTREMIPTELLSYKEVWSALLKDMPMHAMLRNLAKMTAVGMLAPRSSESSIICSRLMSEEMIKKSRLHPIAILNALRVYSQGKGDKGKLTWSPSSEIEYALNDALRLSFQNVERTTQRVWHALDVSGSMYGNKISGTSLDAATAACALVVLNAEVNPHHEFYCFSKALLKMGFPKDRVTPLEGMMKDMKNIPFGATDCALPILHAIKTKTAVDAFVIYTDSETNSNSMHPVEALKQYRKESGINAKLIVVAMCSNGFSIADPNDKNTLDVVGFDTSVPLLINEFISRDEDV